MEQVYDSDTNSVKAVHLAGHTAVLVVQALLQGVQLSTINVARPSSITFQCTGGTMAEAIESRQRPSRRRKYLQGLLQPLQKQFAQLRLCRH